MDNEIEKFQKFLEKELDSFIQLRHEVNKDFADLRISHIKERRGFFIHLTILSGAILGLSKIFLGPLNPYYFWTGFILFLALIIFILFYMREILDREGEGLQKQQDEFNEIFDERIDIILKYMKDTSINKEKIIKFHQELISSKGASKLAEENKKLREEREKRNRSEAPLDFSGEFILFLFVLGTFFIAISLFKYNFPPILLISLVILIFYLTFTDWAIKLTKFISKIITFLTRK